MQKTKKEKLGVKNLSLIITCALFVALFILGSVRYDNFFSLSTFTNLLNDNSYLIIVSVGVTFVLITGGIDISVASTVAFTCVFSAWLLDHGWTAATVIPLVLFIGLFVGFVQGFLIQYFELQPFIVTLAGQFFLRGMCSVISLKAISINDPFYKMMSLGKINIGKARIYYYLFIAIAVIAIAFYMLRFTRFGRNVYAVGGSEQSALLMGLPVARTKVVVYMISSFCAALGGLVYSFYSPAGNALQNMGLELDAISSAVIGGTLLTGGVGSVLGTSVGVLIQGIIQTIVRYEGLSAWWTSVLIASLLCAFIVMQRLFSIQADKRNAQ